MKSKIMSFICCAILMSGLYAQQSDSSNASKFALVMSNKLKDSLSLNNSKANEIYLINLSLHNQKSLARKAYKDNLNQLKIAIQQIENKRDSLYATVLNKQQYNLYKSKKGKLITANL